MANPLVDSEELKKLNKDLSKIGEGLVSALGTVENDILKVLTAGALEIRNDILNSMFRGEKTGKPYKRGGKVHTASAPGESPAVDRGELARSILFDVREPMEVEIGAFGGAPYAAALENGAEYEDGHIMEPRPFLAPAVEKNRQMIIDAIGQAAFEVIKKVVEKATK